MDIAYTLVSNDETVLEEAKKHAMLNCSYQDRCTLLLLALQTKDPQLYIHSRRVQQLTQYLTRALHLSGAQRATIVLAALLHDIGKLVIRDEVLQKPSRLKQEEFEHIKQHPTSGALILRQMGMPHDIVLLVSQHHECWDGSGYPGGLCGETIPLGARIIAIADAFEAMTSDRVYQSSRAPVQALEELRQCAGTQFDPVLVDRFCTSLEADLPDTSPLPNPVPEAFPITAQFLQKATVAWYLRSTHNSKLPQT